MRAKDLTGRRFGRLTVIELHSAAKHGTPRTWLCKCDCGGEKVVNSSRLLRGLTRSCGCLRKETSAENGRKTIKHGMNGTRLYTIWGSMLKRCRCERDRAYALYGGRGITVCEDWYRFENFRDWAFDSGYRDDLTIDRKDNDKGYSPDNCRWVTQKVQGNNRRNNRFIEIDGETHTVAEWSEISGTKRMTIHARLRRGMPEKLAVFGNDYARNR